MRIAEVSSAEAMGVGSMREGVLDLKILLTGDDDSPNNYCLQMNRTGAGGWGTPRHRHNFDQVRYILKGSYPYAKGKSMPEGSVCYFPESVSYGPQERPEGLEMLTCQFGGASGLGFLSVARREAANEALKKRGEFKNGIFTYVDEQGQRHNQDGSEACFEEATGEKVKFAKARYDDIVLMNPASFEWMPDTTPGVATKWLGTFTERQTKVALTRIEAGAIFEAGTQDGIELVFLSKGRLVFDGRELAQYTAFEFQPKEGPLALKAASESEILRVLLPRF